MEDTRGLTVSSELRGQILSHVRRAQPKEAVGLLGGNVTGKVSVALPLSNIAPGNGAFLADPYSQFCALRRLEAKGLQMLAIYHSHPDGGVDPSHDDLAYARRWPCAHAIIAVDTHSGAAARVRAFRCNDRGDIEDVEIRLL